MKAKAQHFFVTGTDTEVGKTVITLGLMSALQSQVDVVNGLKPIASDARREGSRGSLRNSDAVQIQGQCSTELSYDAVNPVCFEPAIAPHIAAVNVGDNLSVDSLNRTLSYPDSEVLLVEGAGGWLTPLNRQESYADWVELQQFPVILVVGMKLGCLNHALLTADNIRSRGLELAGWVSNANSQAMDAFADNFSYLEQALGAPCLGKVPYLENISPADVAQYLDVTALLKA